MREALVIFTCEAWSKTGKKKVAQRRLIIEFDGLHDLDKKIEEQSENTYKSLSEQLRGTKDCESYPHYLQQIVTEI